MLCLTEKLDINFARAYNFNIMNVRLLTLTLINIACVAASGTEIFVAPNGNDQNPGTRSRPFASFQRAQEAVRAERAGRPQNAVTVTFRAGVYHLERPIEFASMDSGNSAALPVVYRAQEGTTVVISGGRTIGGWSADPGHPEVWKAPVAQPWRFNQLWVNGKRAIRARSPNYWEFNTIKSVAEEAAGNRFKHT